MKLKPKSWIIYQATNLVNGKRYIGMTSQSLAGRRSAHKQQALKSSTPYYFQRAIRAYGIDMFRFRVVSVATSRAEAATLEMRLIWGLRPQYNMTAGGDSPTTGDAESLKRWRAALRITSLSRRRSVICLSDGKIFDSLREAATAYKVSPSAICRAVKARRATVAGRLFSYYTGVEAPVSDCDAVIASLRKEQNTRFAANQFTRRVRCLNDGRSFRSISDAAKFYGRPRRSIDAALGGAAAHAWGLRFAYEDEIREKSAASRRPQMVRSAGGTKPVICLTDGLAYPSAISAGEAYGISGSRISAAASGKNKTTGGRKFRYVGLT